VVIPRLLLFFVGRRQLGHVSKMGASHLFDLALQQHRSVRLTQRHNDDQCDGTRELQLRVRGFSDGAADECASGL
jgi:hypothetical protein